MANPYGDTPTRSNPHGDLPSSDKPGWIDTLKTLDFGRAGGNAPQSAAGVLEAAAMPVYRPKETLEGIGTMGMMGLENFASNIPGFEDMPTPQKDQFKSYLSDRYGTPEALKESIETDPMGMVVDAMGVLWGGKGMALMAKRGAAEALPENLPNDMVKEIAKFPRRNLTNAEVDDLVEFMLEENIPFSAQGIERLDDIINTTGARIEKMIERADTGQTIPRHELNKVLQDMKQETVGKTAMGSKDRKVIDSVIDGWESEIVEAGKADFTLKELQKFKQDTYGKVHWAKTDSNRKNVRNAALKAQALDAKSRLEAEVPGIKEANRRQGKALELKPLAEGTTQRIERNKGNMGQTLGIGAGTGIGVGVDAAFNAMGAPIPIGTATALGAGLGTIKGAFGKPQRKQSLAQMIYDARRADPNLVDVPLAKAMAIYLSRENQAQNQ